MYVHFLISTEPKHESANLVFVCARTLSHVLILVIPWNVACQAPLWYSPGKNTGVGHQFLLQGNFLTQGLNPGLSRLLHWQRDSSPLCYLQAGTSKSSQRLTAFLPCCPKTICQCEVSVTCLWHVAHFLCLENKIPVRTFCLVWDPSLGHIITSKFSNQLTLQYIVFSPWKPML